MKKSLKMFLSALLALVLILSAVPAAFALDPGQAAAGGEVYTDYLSVYAQGKGAAEIVFVSTRKCAINTGKHKEYFSFRVVDGQIIFTSADGEEICMEEDGKRGVADFPLRSGETVHIVFSRADLHRIRKGKVIPTRQAAAPDQGKD